MYTFIVNPNSRSGMGRYVWKEIQVVLDNRQIKYKAFFTKHQKHATKIVRELTSDGETHTIIAVGGDGTVNEVVNGLVHPDKVTLGSIPTGSRNDFARSYGLPTNPVEALENILSSKFIEKMDIGELSYKNKKRRFAVSSGMGFDAAICHEVVVSKLKTLLNKFKLGKLVYVFIALRQWLFLTPEQVTITLDNTESHTFSRCYLIASMNHRYAGGGFMFAPKANPSDGKLSICAITDMPKLKMLLLLPTAFWGKHVYFKGVHTYDCKTIHIHSQKPLALHTDGEPWFLQNDISLTCLPTQLNVITLKKY